MRPRARAARTDGDAHCAQRRGRGRVAWIAAALLFAVWGLAVRQAFREHANTLHANGRWRSSKAELSKGLVGAVATLTTRTALHRGELDLGAWHGFQELVLAERLDVETASARIALDPEAYVCLRLDQGAESWGLRIDRGTAGRSRFYRASLEGEWTESWPVQVAGLTERPGRQREHVVSLERSADGACTFRVDDVIWGEIDGPPGPVSFGFRGGRRSVRVDDVRLHERGTQRVMAEDFAPTAPGWGVFALAWVLPAILVGAASHFISRAAARGRRDEHASRAGTRTLLAAGTLATLGLLGFVIVFRVRDARYPRTVDFEGHETRIEQGDTLLPRLALETARPADAPWRVLLVGSSQTWGAGAHAEEATFARRTEALLEARLGERVAVLNAGISAARSGVLFDNYRSTWLRWRPHLTVVDLGYNDRAQPERLVENVRALVELGRFAGTDTLIVLEPISSEVSDPELERSHALLGALAAELDVPVVDMQAELDAHRERGFLFWDAVHLTSFGHRLFAEALAPRVADALSAR